MEVSAEPGKDGGTGAWFDGRTDGRSAGRFLSGGADSWRTFCSAGVECAR